MEKTVDQQHYLLNKLFKAQDRFYYEAAAKAKLSETAFRIMYSLYDSRKSITQSELCKDWYYSKQTINSAVKKLEEMEYVHLNAETGKGNRKRICLTPKGNAYGDENIKPLICAEKAALRCFTNEERELLLSLMQKQLQQLKESTGNTCK
ncbi:MAG: MarR family transcriptional regulator [Oscillospiraceae bacterium]|nr:MarR family transcriptional regulator [Oscillospiraceae bacterium]